MHGRRGRRRPSLGWAVVCLAPLAAEARQLLARQVNLGGAHSCAVLEDDSTKCWGDNADGLLGYGDTISRGRAAGEMGDALPTVDFGTGRRAVHLSAGSFHRCAILDDGSTKCWGKGTSGALGYGDSRTRGDDSGEMGDALPVVDLGTNRTAKKLSTGHTHSCAILDNGRVKCWGSADVGQLGLGDTVNRGDEPGEMGDALPYVDLGTGVQVVDIVSGDYHTCVLMDDGLVKCFGDNQEGELGIGDSIIRGANANSMGDNLPAVDLGTNRTATSIVAGWYHSCAILDNGDLKCWGYGSYGQLGAGDTAWHGSAPGQMGDALLPVNLGTGRYAVQATAGAAFSCALLDNGDVKCWGNGAYGQLGYGDSSHRGTDPTQMGDALPAIDFGTGRRAVRLESGDLHSCAFLDDGALKCWGSNTDGQLGLESTATHGLAPGTMGDNLPELHFGLAPTTTTTTETTSTQTATTTTSSTATGTTSTSSTATETNTTTATSATTTTASTTSASATTTSHTSTATTSSTSTAPTAASTTATFAAMSSAAVASTTVGAVAPTSTTAPATTVSVATTPAAETTAPATTTAPAAATTVSPASTTSPAFSTTNASEAATVVGNSTTPQVDETTSTTTVAAAATTTAAASAPWPPPLWFQETTTLPPQDDLLVSAARFSARPAAALLVALPLALAALPELQTPRGRQGAPAHLGAQV